MIKRAHLFFLLLLIIAAPAWAQAPKSVCIDCHSALDGNLKVTDDDYAADIHAQKGLTCAACHGGDPSDPDNAMSKAKGFKGHIDRARIPELCGSCHSNPTYMKTFNPSLRTDQLAEYKTSIHGKKLAGGDTNVAVCTDCHGVHPVRPPSDPNAKVHPLNIATTCSRCHSDRDKMKAYGIKTDQYAGYSVSVHAEAMTVRGDLSAPTCTTCHGNHGATPPGVGSVENICATCHVFQAQLYEQSPHKAAQSMGGPNCITCHSNHHIVHPNDTMIGTDSKAVCTTCHMDGDAGFKFAGETHLRLAKLETSIADSEALLDEAAHSGIEISQAKLDQNEARDDLTKARVSIHSFDPKKVWADTDAGMKVAAKTHAAGEAALQERHFRRMGLTVSLVTILLMLIGLGLYIHAIEEDGSGIQQGSSH
jgi:cytochrome c3-like protein